MFAEKVGDDRVVGWRQIMFTALSIDQRDVDDWRASMTTDLERERFDATLAAVNARNGDNTRVARANTTWKLFAHATDATDGAEDPLGGLSGPGEPPNGALSIVFDPRPGPGRLNDVAKYQAKLQILRNIADVIEGGAGASASASASASAAAATTPLPWTVMMLDNLSFAVNVATMTAVPLTPLVKPRRLSARLVGAPIAPDAFVFEGLLSWVLDNLVDQRDAILTQVEAGGIAPPFDTHYFANWRFVIFTANTVIRPGLLVLSQTNDRIPATDNPHDPDAAILQRIVSGGGGAGRVPWSTMRRGAPPARFRATSADSGVTFDVTSIDTVFAKPRTKAPKIRGLIFPLPFLGAPIVPGASTAKQVIEWVVDEFIDDGAGPGDRKAILATFTPETGAAAAAAAAGAGAAGIWPPSSKVR